MKVRSFASLPAHAVRDACMACADRIAEARRERENAALDAEIARRAKGWPWGLFKRSWTREDARRYFSGFSGLDAYMNPLWYHPSDQLIAAKRLLALASGAILSGVQTVHVTASDFDHISSFYGQSHSAA